MVLEQHGDMPGPSLVERTQPTQQEVGQTHGLVAVLAIGPATLVLAEEDPPAYFCMLAASLDLGAQSGRSVELVLPCAHRMPPIVESRRTNQPQRVGHGVHRGLAKRESIPRPAPTGRRVGAEISAR
ncbi:MAG: hypothetical protein M5U32_14655 [Myxococcota bacterium]|nr:hypothetical protein [Myxococcota bacterium]